MVKITNNTMLTEAKLAKNKPNAVLQVLIFLAVFLLIQIVTLIVLIAPTFSYMASSTEIQSLIMSSSSAKDTINMSQELTSLLMSNDNYMLLVLLTTIFETLFSIMYCVFIEKRSLRSMGFIKKDAVKNYCIGFAIGAVMISASFGIAAMFGGLTVSISRNVSVIYMIAFLIGFIIQGMAEEVMMRGYFMMSLTNRVPIAAAVIISSLVFSVLHALNPGVTLLSLANIVLIGIFFGLYVLRTGNIWGSCALHTAWNFIQGNIIGIEVSGTQYTTSVFKSTASGSFSEVSGGSFGLEGGLAVMIVAIVAICCVLFIPQKKENGPKMDLQASTGV